MVEGIRFTPDNEIESWTEEQRRVLPHEVLVVFGSRGKSHKSIGVKEWSADKCLLVGHKSIRVRVPFGCGSADLTWIEEGQYNRELGADPADVAIAKATQGIDSFWNKNDDARQQFVWGVVEGSPTYRDCSPAEVQRRFSTILKDGVLVVGNSDVWVDIEHRVTGEWMKLSKPDSGLSLGDIRRNLIDLLGYPGPVDHNLRRARLRVGLAVAVLMHKGVYVGRGCHGVVETFFDFLPMSEGEIDSYMQGLSIGQLLSVNGGVRFADRLFGQIQHIEHTDRGNKDYVPNQVTGGLELDRGKVERQFIRRALGGPTEMMDAVAELLGIVVAGKAPRGMKASKIFKSIPGLSEQKFHSRVEWKRLVSFPEMLTVKV